MVSLHLSRRRIDVAALEKQVLAHTWSLRCFPVSQGHKMTHQLWTRVPLGMRRLASFMEVNYLVRSQTRTTRFAWKSWDQVCNRIFLSSMSLNSMQVTQGDLRGDAFPWTSPGHSWHRRVNVPGEIAASASLSAPRKVTLCRNAIKRAFGARNRRACVD